MIDTTKLLPFDLETALKYPERVYTRDGRKARIVCHDANRCCPVLALITEGSEFESEQFYYTSGACNSDPFNGMSLMLLPEPAKLRAWKTCEVPLGWEVRPIEPERSVERFLIVGVTTEGMRLGMWQNYLPLVDALQGFQCRPNAQFEWFPCGVPTA